MRRKTSMLGGEAETAMLEPEMVIMKGAPESIKAAVRMRPNRLRLTS